MLSRTCKLKITYIITLDIENSDYKDRDKNNTNMKTMVDMLTNLVQICNKIRVFVGAYILSVNSPFSDRVGLPLQNIHIPSPFTSIMDILFVDLKFGLIRFYTL